jgi:hypothetical protein
MKKIDTIEQWNILAAAMHKQEWQLWQWQYGWNHAEGFHAWFMRHGRDVKDSVEVETHNKNVQMAIVEYNSMK